MIRRDYLKYKYYGPDMPEVLFSFRVNPHFYRDAPRFSIIVPLSVECEWLISAQCPA
jgi:hypothetical protein